MNQAYSIPVCTTGRPETRHGYSDNPVSRNAQQVKSHNRNQQSQRRVQSSGNADNCRLGMGMSNSLGQAGGLHLKYLFATLA